MQHTVAILKPDAVQRGLVGEILHTAAQHGLYPVAMRMERMSEILVRSFYAEHVERDYYKDLSSFMCSGPSVFVLFKASSPEMDAIATWRTLMGSTNPSAAAYGTLRRRYGVDGPVNVAHGSDSPEAVARECMALQLFDDARPAGQLA